MNKLKIKTSLTGLITSYKITMILGIFAVLAVPINAHENLNTLKNEVTTLINGHLHKLPQENRNALLVLLVYRHLHKLPQEDLREVESLLMNIRDIFHGNGIDGIEGISGNANLICVKKQDYFGIKNANTGENLSTYSYISYDECIRSISNN